jgi:site-specific recombinase XerD
MGVSVHRVRGRKFFRLQWADGTGKVHTRTLRDVTDKRTVSKIRDKLAGELALEREGLVDPAQRKLDRAAKVPIAELIDGWRAAVQGGTAAGYAAAEARLVARVFELAGVKTLGDIAPGPVRATIERMSRERGEGTLSARQKSKALDACQRFTAAMVRDGNLKADPLAGVKGWTLETDRRHTRAAFTAAEARAVIAAARNSPDTVQGLTGPQRAVLYDTAAATGFRRRTLLALTPAHLHLAADPPFIRIRPENVKNKKDRDQMIPAPLAAVLRAYARGMKPADRLFPASARADTAAMMRHDVAAAGLDYEPEPGTFRDFASWRNTYGTELGRATGNIRVVQDMMMHSTPVLTARYMRPTMTDYRAAVDALPDHGAKAEQRKAEGA